MADDNQAVPKHIESTVQTIARLHDQHYRDASRLQQKVERATARIGRPATIIILTIFLITWIAGNLGIILFGGKPLDGPPFSWLQLGASLMALYVTLVILATQRREDKLAASRAQLTLEIAILSEQKTAKIIEMLEALRRDSPHLDDRLDSEAQEMAVPSDPESVLNAINETYDNVSSRNVFAD